MRVFQGLAAAAALMLFVVAGPVAHAFEPGPAVGATLPHTLAAADQAGAPQSRWTVAGEKGFVIAFSRSADWCPICQRQLIELNEALPEIKARGFNLVSVTTDAPAELAPFVKRRAIAYPMLADPDKKIIDAFMLRDPAFPPGNRIHGVPVPALFVVSSTGVILAKLGDEDYKVRPPTTDLLAALDALK